MRVAVVQVAYDDAEPMPERVERVSALVRATVDGIGTGDGGRPDLVVLPELWGPTGFDYRRWEDLAEPLDGSWVTAMTALARELSIALHAGSFVERLDRAGPDGRTLANTSVLVTAEGERTAYRKIHRFGFGSGEPRLLEAGTEVVTARLAPATGGRTTVGLSTCYDLRFPELYRQQVDAGAEMFVVPAAWPAARVGHWTLLGRARAVEDQAFVVQCNTAGTHARTEMGGRSQVVAPNGDVLAEAGAEQEVLVVDVDLSLVASTRTAFPVLGDRRL